jgi:hypothetical protein
MEAPMTEIIRHCPDCGRGRLFAQHHGPAGCCPDSVDQYCPEWYCVVCGATLVIGAVPAAFGATTATAATGRRDRVA